MARRPYRIIEGGLHEKFQASRKKIQIFGGGFGNGKTTGAVMKALQLCRDYPGSNGLIARSTYPKLNDTIRKEFLAWCPPAWIERKNLSQDNVVVLKGGTTINFRYVAQGGKSNESSTSNLLSATYDWIVVDQVEDPEITEKDFLDLLGRLRGQTPYVGDDVTMPSSGPRWCILMCNPTRNWVYRKLIKPLQDYAAGIKNPDLMIDPDTGEPAIDLFEGSTYDNKENLPADFIKGLEMSYKGQMRERFLLGKWGAYEGLVYPDYDVQHHIMDHDLMVQYYDEISAAGGYNNVVEAYDHGIAVPAAYGFGFTDQMGNVFILDGFYEKEQTIRTIALGIKEIRDRYDYQPIDDEGLQGKIWADPAIFRRTSGNSKTVGTTVSGLFREEGIKMVRGNNDIVSGIAKIQSYMYIDPMHPHPVYEGVQGAPRLYVSNKLTWWDAEISDYYWKKNATTGEYEDTPMDRNDHGMDMMKYMFTNRPRVAVFRAAKESRPAIPVKYSRWREHAMAGADNRAHRYGRR
jgi:hypothetical protein